MIELANLFHTALVCFQRVYGRYLYRREHAVVEVGFHTRQSGNQGGIATAEAHPPARHIVALGQGVKLYRDVFGAFHLQNRGRLITVVNQIGVGQILHHPDFVLAGDLDDFLEEFEFHAMGGGIRGEIQHQHLRLGPAVANGLFQLVKKAVTITHGHMANIGTGDDEAIGVNRVRGVWHQNRITGAGGCQRQMSQPFL